MSWRLFFYMKLSCILASELINNVSLMNGFILIEIIFKIVTMTFFRRLKSITNLKLSLLITVEVISSNSMKFIFIINVKLLCTLFMDFSWLNLVCRFVFHRWSEDSALIFLLMLDNTEEKIHDTDWVQFFILIKIYEPHCADFSFASTDSLYFYLNKVNIFFHYKIVDCLVSNSTLILLV